MRWHWILLCLLAGGVALYGAADKPVGRAGGEAAGARPAPVALDTTEQKVSYTLGLNIGGTLAQQGFDPEELELDLDVFLQGLRDALTHEQPRITRAQMQEAMAAFEQRMEQRQGEREVQMRIVAQQNLQAGEAFLAENQKKEGVEATESGLQYEVLDKGEGPSPDASDVVKVHYRGTLLNGQVFDSSYDRGEPVVFPLDGVIAGWTEGVQLMNVGSKHKLFIPAHLAYGERGRPGIPPNSTLIFEIELLGIEQE